MNHDKNTDIGLQGEQDFELEDFSESGIDPEARSAGADKEKEKGLTGLESSGQKEETRSSNKSAGAHEGKLFVAQKGKAICDKGTKFPQFKVTAQNKFHVNDQKGKSDYLAVTENDLQFNPPAMPFGNCSLQNGRPCTFAPAGKWQKFYKDMKVSGNCLLTEISELQCAIGGKIKIMDHGQRAQLTKQNFKHARAKVHQHLNPALDLDEFNDELEGNNNICV